MASKERQMTLEEIQKRLEDDIGSSWRVRVVNKENGHVQIRTDLKTP